MEIVMCDGPMRKRRRVFLQSWLTDDRFKSWIREVPGDDSLFFCTYCNKTFSCDPSHVPRHAKSESHKRMSVDGATRKKSQPWKKKFLHHWLEIEEFKPWLQEVPGNPHNFYCSVCEMTFASGLTQIKRHGESKCHILRCEKLGLQITKSEESNDEILSSFRNRRKTAEIRFAALIAEHNLPLHAAEAILSFFKNMSSDPHVLNSMTMNRTKCSNVISNVLCPRETERVVDSLRHSKFTLFLNETTDSNTVKWMRFLVRYVDPETLDVQIELVKLIDLGTKTCSTDKLFTTFKHEMWKHQIPFNNIFALSYDNESIATERYTSFKNKLTEVCGTNLLALPCPCHSVELVVHAACTTLPDSCEYLLRKMTTFINSNPKCSAVFREFMECFQERDLKIMKLSNTLWLSRYTCIDKLLQSWDKILKIVQEMGVKEKSKSGEQLLTLMQNIETKAYFLFLRYIFDCFNQFNERFQSQETSIHLLHSGSVELLQFILQHFLKPTITKFINFVRNIDFAHPENQKPLHKVFLGEECEAFLCQLTKQGQIDVAETIREKCLGFYITAAVEICNQLPIDNEFLRALYVFRGDSALCDVDRKTSIQDVLFVATQLGNFNEEGLIQEWSTLHQDFDQETVQTLIDMDFDEMWKAISLATDEHEEIRYPNLRNLLNSIRTLPNSNASARKSFPALPNVKHRNKLSTSNVNAICVVKSALKARGKTAQTMEIDERHLSLMASKNLYKSNNKTKKLINEKI